MIFTSSKMKLLIYLTIVFVLSVNGLLADYCSHKIENAKGISEKCSKQLRKLCSRHDLLFSFYDSSSRQIHTGLSATNNEDYGNYDSCMSINSKADDVEILGKFCPLQWATRYPKAYLEELVFLMEEFNPINMMKKDLLELEKQNHTFKNIVDTSASDSEMITMLGSICIPDECSPDEFTKVFNPYFIPVNMEMKNATTNCFTKGANLKMTTFELIVTICVGVIFFIVIGATAFHLWLHNRNDGSMPHELVKAFSVLHNGKNLIKISKENPDQIQSIHGLRFLSMLWVIAGHTFACAEILPHFNEKDVKEWRSNLYAQYILAGPYAVDTFFFLSGLLLAYGYMKQMKEVKYVKQISAIPLMILHRYLRLTPAAAAMFFVSLSFLKAIGNGPLWIYMVDAINQPCRDYWWRYFFYIQNYSKEICYTQTWYLSADMQMFVVAPVVLIPSAIYFRKHLRAVVTSLIGLIVFCVGLSIGIRYIVDDYTNNYDTHSRLSDYLVGIIGGIVMHTQRGKDIKINKVVNLVVWIVTLAVMLFLALYLNDIIVNPTKDKENFFYPIQRPIWCAGLLWIVFSCHNGYGGVINKFLSLSCFQIGSRLSYSIYIVHAMVILYYTGQVRTYQFITDYTVLYLLCGNVAACIVVATIWTLSFEAPMVILNKMLLGKLGSPKK